MLKATNRAMGTHEMKWTAANAVVGIVKIMFFPAAYADSLIWRGGGGGDIQKRSFFCREESQKQNYYILK